MPSISQVTGMKALGLIDMITGAARNAATHKRNCEQLADHVRLIGNLLEKLKGTSLMELPATSEPLTLLEEALGRALDLVRSCRDKSYLYLLSMGWSVVYQFRHVQNEIDSYLNLIPLISLVHEFRIQSVKESLEAIAADHREYTLDEEDVEAQNAILKPDRSKKDANVLEKSLSRRYPDLQFHEAIQEEKEKLQHELQRLQVNNDPKQCRVIEHLIDVTHSLVSVSTDKNLALNLQPYIGTGRVSTDVSRASKELDSWQADLFDCCSEPCLSIKACIYPCGIFSRIANVVSRGKISKPCVCVWFTCL